MPTYLPALSYPTLTASRTIHDTCPTVSTTIFPLPVVFPFSAAHRNVTLKCSSDSDRLVTLTCSSIGDQHVTLRCSPDSDRHTTLKCFSPASFRSVCVGLCERNTSHVYIYHQCQPPSPLCCSQLLSATMN